MDPFLPQCTSPIIEGDSFALPLWYQALQPDEAEPIVRECVEHGYAQIKIYNALTPDALRALGQAAAALHLRLVGHCPTAMTFEEAMDAGVSCFEHLVGIWRGHLRDGLAQRPDQSNLALEVILMTAAHLDGEALRRLAHQMARHEVWNCPTLVALQWMQEAQATGATDPAIQPWLKHVPRLAEQVWKHLDPSHRPDYARWIQGWHARNEALLQVVSVLHEEGAPLLLGTDTPVRFVIPGHSVHQELGNLVQAGLTPFEALGCGTREAARFLDQTPLRGTIAVGKRADLLLLRANPLEDVTAVQALDAVFVNGFYLTVSDLEALLQQQERLSAGPTVEALSSPPLKRTTRPATWERHEEWTEYTDDLVCGMLQGRQQILSTGEWLIEERYRFEQGNIFFPGGIQQRTTTVLLHADFTLRRGSYVLETFAGTERADITWSAEDGYVLQRQEVDGSTSHQTLQTVPLFPDERLGLSMLPLFLERAPHPLEAAPILCLSLGARKASTAEMQITLASGPDLMQGSSEKHWRVRFQHPASLQERLYRCDQTGRCVSIQEGQRTWRATSLRKPPKA